MAYLEEMLVRQALAAQEQQAAQELLRRLQAAPWAAEEKKRTDMPLPETEESRRAETEGTETLLTEREAAEGSDRVRKRSAVPTEDFRGMDAAQHSNAPVQRLLRQLASLAGLTGELGYLTTQETTGMELQLPESANWMRMAARLERAVRGTQTMPQTAQRSERLASDGPRSMEPYGQADAAALSRLYERDARRYDSRFELPL